MHSVKPIVFAISVLAAGVSAKPLDLGSLNEASAIDLGPLDELPSATPSLGSSVLSDLPAPTAAPDLESLGLPPPTGLPDLKSLGLPSPTGLSDLGSLDLPAPTSLPKLTDDLDLGFLEAPVGDTGAMIGVPMMINYAAPNVNQPATIVLHKGTSKKQQNMGTLTTTAKGGFYLWTPAKTLQAGKDYALEIRQGDHSNMSPLFSLRSLSLPSFSLPLVSPLAGALAQATKLPLPSSGLLDSPSFKTTPVRAPLPKAQALATGVATPLFNNTNNATPTLSKTYVPTAAVVSSSSPSPSTGAASNLGCSSAVSMIGGLAAALVLLA